MSKHRKFSPSASSRWLQCPGSIQAIAALPEKRQEGKSSIAAEEGTAAHKLCEYGFRGKNVDFYLDKKINGIYVDEDMIAGAKMLMQHVREVQKPFENGCVYSEEEYDLSKHFDGEDIGGTTDVAMVALGHCMHIIDYKYGRVNVEIKDNSQLLIYTLKRILHFDTMMQNLMLPEIFITIVQPRGDHVNGPVRTERYTPAEIVTWCDDVLRTGIELCNSGNPPLVAGEEQCKYCPVAPTCVAAAAHVITVAQHDFKEVFEPKAPKELSKKQLRLILESRAMMVAWLNNVEEYAKDLALEGKTPKGFKLVEKRTHRKFNGSEHRLKGLLVAQGVDTDLLYKTQLKSPNQLEQILISEVGKDKAKELVSRVTHKPQGGLDLVLKSDPRPKLAVTAEEEFSHIKT